MTIQSWIFPLNGGFCRLAQAYDLDASAFKYLSPLIREPIVRNQSIHRVERCQVSEWEMIREAKAALAGVGFTPDAAEKHLEKKRAEEKLAEEDDGSKGKQGKGSGGGKGWKGAEGRGG